MTKKTHKVSDSLAEQWEDYLNYNKVVRNIFSAFYDSVVEGIDKQEPSALRKLTALFTPCEQPVEKLTRYAAEIVIEAEVKALTKRDRFWDKAFNEMKITPWSVALTYDKETKTITWDDEETSVEP